MQKSYQHPAFPQPQEPAALLWRYMHKDRFTWLVEHGRVFMASADRLGDPFEGSVPHGELEWWKREATNAGSNAHRRIVEYDRAFLSAMAEKWRDQCFVSCWHMNVGLLHSAAGIGRREDGVPHPPRPSTQLY
jgi:hypothetical protein